MHEIQHALKTIWYLPVQCCLENKHVCGGKMKERQISLWILETKQQEECDTEPDGTQGWFNEGRIRDYCDVQSRIFRIRFQTMDPREGE